MQMLDVKYFIIKLDYGKEPVICTFLPCLIHIKALI